MFNFNLGQWNLVPFFGDRHLFLEPVPDPIRNLTLAARILIWPDGGIHAAIGGEVFLFLFNYFLLRGLLLTGF